MRSKVLGIDPGATGALASIEGDKISVIPMPRIGKEISITNIRNWLATTSQNPFSLAVIEKVHAFPGQGVCGVFSFGKTYGILIAIVEMLDIPYILVTPQRWKKSILEGTRKDKDAAIQFCRRRFPATSLKATPRCTKNHDGIADALCLVEWGRRYLGGK